MKEHRHVDTHTKGVCPFALVQGAGFDFGDNVHVQLYALLAVFYLVIISPLSRLSAYVEAKLS